MDTPDKPVGDRRERLLLALKAANKAGNPYLAKSILLALEGHTPTVEDAFDG